MTISQIVFIALTIAALSVGQVLFKLAAMDMKNISFLTLLQPKLILALCVYAVATVLWIGALRTTPLRLAYPFASLAFFIVPILSWLWIGEAISLNTFLGAAVILIGVWISVS